MCTGGVAIIPWSDYVAKLLSVMFAGRIARLMNDRMPLDDEIVTSRILEINEDIDTIILYNYTLALGA